MLKGGCFCGAVRYEAAGPAFHLTSCHCTTCRRSSGAAFVTWFSVRSSDFRFVCGAPTGYQSSAKGVRSFCPGCGSQLTFQVEGSDEIDVTTCTLDDAEWLPPEDHTWTRSRLSWIKLADGLPGYRTTRTADD